MINRKNKIFAIIVFTILSTIGVYAKTIVVSANEPLQKQFTRRATYVVRDAINLGGSTLIIPKKSTLNFEGGSIENGSVVLNKTTIKGTPLLLTNVSGTVKNKQLLVDWFINENDLDNLFNGHAYALDGYKELIFSPRDYIVSVHKSSDGIQICNKIILGNNCTIRAKQGGNLTYSVLPIYNSMNVSVRDLNIIGSNESSSIEGSRHNLCITKCINISLENISTTNAFTDGLYLRDNDGVFVSNLMAKNNGRQGCSITSGKNISISNSVFSGSYRVPPMSGLDIEPSLPKDYVTGVSISDCTFSGNKANGLSIYLKECLTIPDVYINVNDCVFDDNNVNVSVRSAKNSGQGEIFIHNSKLANSQGVGFQSKCYSSVNTPHVTFKDSEISNANLANGADVREQSAFISIHNVSSSSLNTDFGNITIDNIVFAQQGNTDIDRCVSLYVDPSMQFCLDNIQVTNVGFTTNKVFTDSYNDYLVYVPKGKIKNVRYNNHHEVVVEKNITKAITPASKIIVRGGGVISLKEQVRTDLFPEIIITCQGGSKVKDLSSEPLYFSDGTIYKNQPLGGTVVISNRIITCK